VHVTLVACGPDAEQADASISREADIRPCATKHDELARLRCAGYGRRSYGEAST